jgi:enoyl-CoA hydratase
MYFKNLIMTKENEIAILKLNRCTKLNALNLPLFDELNCALNDLTKDIDIKAVILYGNDKIFGAGSDLNMIKNAAPTSVEANLFFRNRANPVYDKLYQLDKPVIAAISGLAMGGVFELALACDLRIASETATFGLPEIKLGLIPGGGGTQRLPRIVGLTKAAEILFTGETFDAREAYRIGLLNKVVAPEMLLEEAVDMAKKLAAKPRFALKMLKSAMNTGFELPLNLALEYERRCFEMLFSTQDAQEGMNSFLEKRKPQFLGK